jgi:hypothetical protein
MMIDIDKVRSIATAGVPRTSTPELASSLRRVRVTIHLAAFVGVIALATIPAFAEHSYFGHSSTGYHVWNDPTTKAFSRNGLPCSTASVSGLSASKPAGSLRELDLIEHQSVIALKNASERGNGKAAPYRPAVSHGSERQSAINFVYHAPVSGGAEAGRTSASSRHY